MKYDVITIGDTMKDTFLFPSLQEMYKPIDGVLISERVRNEKFLVFQLGDKITITETYNSIGGTACNVAVGLSRLKIKTVLISAVGNDSEGQEVIEKLKKDKVNVGYLKIYLSRKTSFSIIVSYKGERTILVRHNFEPNDFIIPAKIESNWLYVGPLGGDYRKLYAKITGLAVQKNIKIAINPGSIQIHDGLSAFGGLLSIAKIIFLNREEAQSLTGITSITTIKELACNLRTTGVEMVVITDGQNGAYLSYKDDFLKVGPYPSKRVEATGAGDAFAAGFLAALLKNETMLSCLKWGAINSASVVSKYGAQQGLLSMGQVGGKLEEYRWPASDLRFS